MIKMIPLVTLWIMMFLKFDLVLANNIHVSPSGVVFSESDETILLGPSTDKILLHLAMELPKLEEKYENNCQNKYQNSRASGLTNMSDKVRKWFLKMLNMNLNTRISVQTLRNFVIQGKNNITRNRRSFQFVKDGYFLLSSWSENKFEHAYEYNHKMFSKVQGSLNNLKVRLTKQNQLLSNIAYFICNENNKIDLNSKLDNIKLSYLDYVKTISLQISEAQYGTVPSQINYDLLLDLCQKTIRQNMESKVCSTLNLRTFFDLQFKQLIMDNHHNALVLEIQIAIPKSHEDQYKVFDLVFIPTFSNNTISQLNTDAQAVGLSLESKSMIAFNSCYKKLIFEYITIN